MRSRYLYIARHGMADAFGELTDEGRRQAALLGERLAAVPVENLWHSPLPRAAATAELVGGHLPGVAVRAAEELIDNVPHVPRPDETPRSWRGFFDGYDPVEADRGRRLADALVVRFARPAEAAPSKLSTSRSPTPSSGAQGLHEVLITHAYPIAWLLRDAMGAPPGRWLGLTGSANTALTVVEYHHGLPPTLLMFNDLSHLPADLRWTGFPGGAKP
jgi:probable phosphoglycerate mutase